MEDAGPWGAALAKKAPPGQTLFSNFLFFQPLQEDFDFSLFVILKFFFGAPMITDYILV
jgi:hypothetical protein